MCGIAGILSHAPLTPAETAQVLAANELQAHRGPDGSGELVGPHAVLAMRRLSIIDLNGGWQPLYNEDRSLALVANGEVYNFIELRRDLAARGHHFATGSDCETILHLYEEYGVECVQHLRGMYAFALWDRPRQRLLLVRDRMGEKPLFLAEREGQIAFASELKVLVRSGLVPFDLDPAAVDAFLHYQYVPDPATPLRGVRKLPAGHLLVVDLDPWRVHEQKYWDLEDAPPLDGPPAEVLRAELERVSELVVRSDVPVGVALSGGLDSSAVAALAARKYPGQMHAFCVGYAGKVESDERADAKQFADHLGIPFHDVELGLPEVVEFFPELQFWRDSPIADISGQGYYAVMKLAREQGVRVMLQGQGGDELFWGYGWVREAVGHTQRKEQHPHAARVTAAPPPPTAGRARRLLPWLKGPGGAGPSAPVSIPADCPDRMVFLDLAPDFVLASGEARGLYTPEWAGRVLPYRPDGLFTFPRPWPRADLRITRLICDTYLRENGITQGDRLSMASGVELRLPLLDYRLVETVIGLRKARPDHELPPKAWFKEALGGVLPGWVMNRPKRGFAPPVGQWHRALFARHGHLLADGYLVASGVLKPEAARALARGPFAAGAVTPLSFKALVLETWCRAMLGEKRATPGLTGEAARAAADTVPASVREADAELAPVALFVYKRPEHTRRALESLARDPLAGQSHLHIFADAARKPEDREGVAAVRRLIRERPWCGRVSVVEREHNWGLARSIIAGVTDLAGRYGRVVVVEDDLVLAPGFLEYMNEALRRYGHQPRVMQVSGFAFPIAGAPAGGAYFLPLTTSWGWATWKRAWDHFDHDGAGRARLAADPELCRRFDLGGAYPYSSMLQAQREGQVDSWAIRWYLTTFLRQGLTLYPGQSLVDNTGFDGSGTNCGRAPQPTARLGVGAPRDYPVVPVPDPWLFRRVVEHLRPPRPAGWAQRLRGRVHRLLRAG